MKEMVKWDTLEINPKVFSKFKMLVIEVDLYGLPYNFLIDTGANECIIRDTVAKELHDRIYIPDTDDGFIITGIANETAMAKESSITVTVANMNEAVSCNIMDLDNINRFFNDNVEISGIIGNIFLRKASWVIDFHRLVIHYPVIFNVSDVPKLKIKNQKLK
jgi:predicted aspartyl protease